MKNLLLYLCFTISCTSPILSISPEQIKKLDILEAQQQNKLLTLQEKEIEQLQFIHEQQLQEAQEKLFFTQEDNQNAAKILEQQTYLRHHPSKKVRLISQLSKEELELLKIKREHAQQLQNLKIKHSKELRELKNNQLKQRRITIAKLTINPEISQFQKEAATLNKLKAKKEEISDLQEKLNQNFSEELTEINKKYEEKAQKINQDNEDSTNTQLTQLQRAHQKEIQILHTKYKEPHEKLTQEFHNVCLDIKTTLDLGEEERRINQQEQVLNKKLHECIENSEIEDTNFFVLLYLELSKNLETIFNKRNFAKTCSKILLSPIDTGINHSATIYNQKVYQAADYVLGDGGDLIGNKIIGKDLGIRPGEALGLGSKEKRIKNQVLHEYFLDHYGQIPTDLDEFESKLRAGLRADEIVRLYEKYKYEHPTKKESSYSCAHAEEVNDNL